MKITKMRIAAPLELARRFFVRTSRQDTKFLILLPIHRPPNLLKFAIASVLNQTEQDHQLHIISDGAPEETTQEVLAIARRERRVTSHIFAKGERYGETYRDPIIREARSKIICQISDDDVWFPNHLHEIEQLLGTFEFGNTIQTEAAPGRRLRPLLGDISDPETASKMITQPFNIFGPTASGYRKDAYLKLENGWTPAPDSIWSDLHMWRKFLSHGDIRCGTRLSFTNLHIGAPHHTDMRIDQREAANRDWWQTVSDPAALDQLIQVLAKHSLLARSDGWTEFKP